MIDLRSDTVTKPTEEMRRAMAAAEVGDDVYGEDPTVNRLEQRAAEIFAREAALFVPTGTMGNTIGCKLHTRHGQEIIAEARSHAFNYELSMVSWFSGCVVRPVAASDGILSWQAIERHLRPPGPHWAPTGMITVENTHNMAGGTVYPMAVLNDICDRAHEIGLPVHMDGARVFNAATYLEIPVSEVSAKPDTVMFCLSKGLGSPVGSMLVGSHEAMTEARLLRKRLGGGMRQAGVLAAAGLISLERMPERLHQDHANARYLAVELAGMRGITINPAHVQTNIVVFDIAGTGFDPPTFSAELKSRGVLANGISRTEVRMVTHYDVSHADCEKAVQAVNQIVAARQVAYS
ncbi:MAG TPA: GntG family PLP-dependent aldolase [Bryobacteraceae bacterium]|nr:GntG family PLP-dependent aldolase [Bryobacteraceae bacterium]